MLRRTISFTLEAAEVSALLIAEYLGGSGVTADLIASVLAVDQALFTVGISKPLLLLSAFQQSFALKIGRRMCELTVAGCMLCGNVLSQDAAQLFLTGPSWQGMMFDGFWPARLIRMAGAYITPRRLSMWYQSVISGPYDAEEHRASEAFAELVRKTHLDRCGAAGVFSGAWRTTVAENLVCDASAIVSDQLQWLSIYWKEVVTPWRAGKGTFVSLARRTFKSQVASTVLSLTEIIGHLAVRCIGKQVAVKILSRTRFDSRLPAPGVFWIEHALLLLSAPLIVRASQIVAGMSYRAMENAMPSTEDDLRADAEDAERNRDEEADVRDHFMASQNKNDLYEMIGVKPSATETEIKKAYRQRALQYHPDRVAHLSDHEKANAQQAMAALNEAYEVLSCSSKRSMYDSSRAQSKILGFDENNPPKIIESFMRLPMAVQVPIGLSIMGSCLILGGGVFYAHLRSQFLTLTSPGRTPVRAVVLGNSA